jgi:hypothetical protein
MSEPKCYQAMCPECGVTLEIPEQDLVGLWEGDNVGDGKRERDYEIACEGCGHYFFVSELEVATLTAEGEV